MDLNLSIITSCLLTKQTGGVQEPFCKLNNKSTIEDAKNYSTANEITGNVREMNSVIVAVICILTRT